MAKLTKKQQSEFDVLQRKLCTAEERIAVLAREHADMIAELAPLSEEGKTYQSKLALMEAVLDEALAELGNTIDRLQATRHALEIVCSSAQRNQEAVWTAAGWEQHAQVRIIELMKAAKEIVGKERQ